MTSSTGSDPFRRIAYEHEVKVSRVLGKHRQDGPWMKVLHHVCEIPTVLFVFEQILNLQPRPDLFSKEFAEGMIIFVITRDASKVDFEKRQKEGVERRSVITSELA
jgi:hypothetical protein